MPGDTFPPNDKRNTDQVCWNKVPGMFLGSGLRVRILFGICIYIYHSAKMVAKQEKRYLKLTVLASALSQCHFIDRLTSFPPSIPDGDIS